MPSEEEKALPVKVLSTSEAELRPVLSSLPDSMLQSVADSLKRLQDSTGVTLITADIIDVGFPVDSMSDCILDVKIIGTKNVRGRGDQVILMDPFVPGEIEGD